MSTKLSESDENIINDGLLAWFEELDRQEAFMAATGIKRSLLAAPFLDNPDKQLEGAPK